MSRFILGTIAALLVAGTASASEGSKATDALKEGIVKHCMALKGLARNDCYENFSLWIPDLYRAVGMDAGVHNIPAVINQCERDEYVLEDLAEYPGDYPMTIVGCVVDGLRRSPK